MQQVTVLSEPVEVELSLSRFGVTLEMLQKVARVASSARASSLDIDVVFTPGMLSHIHGNRQLRRELLPRGWQIGRQNNVESVVNHELGVQIVFQNVDLACELGHSPQAISGKGSGSRKLVRDGLQGEFWSDLKIESIAPSEDFSKIGITPTVWMFCVSDDAKRLRAELSKPFSFEGNQPGFSQRIFILNEDLGNEAVSVKPTSNDDSGPDIEVLVVRK